MDLPKTIANLQDKFARQVEHLVCLERKIRKCQNPEDLKQKARENELERLKAALEKTVEEIQRLT